MIVLRSASTPPLEVSAMHHRLHTSPLNFPETHHCEVNMDVA